MKTIKSPAPFLAPFPAKFLAQFLAQFAGDAALFKSWKSITGRTAACGDMGALVSGSDSCLVDAAVHPTHHAAVFAAHSNRVTEKAGDEFAGAGTTCATSRRMSELD